MIAVIGATGNTGRAVVKELRALGEDPLCIVRNPDKAREVLGADARTAVAELTDRAALEKALRGVTRVFVVTGHNPQMTEQQNTVLEAAEAAGAKFLVRVSGGRAVVGPDAESVVGRGHHAVEERLRKSSLGWVILRPGLFMQNTLGQAQSIKAESKMVLPFPKDLPIAFIDVRDTGAVGARILREPAAHAGKTYEFTGVTTNYGEFANVFSEVLGRPITYVAITPEQAEQGMKARGMPDWLVTHMVAIARAGANGAFSTENTQPIREIVGRAPITTRQFVEDHKALFR
ncbi:MAG TPA: NmrA family NAD(P)-binding protein [Xanthobacteraceae bacterium]